MGQLSVKYSDESKLDFCEPSRTGNISSQAGDLYKASWIRATFLCARPHVWIQLKKFNLFKNLCPLRIWIVILFFCHYFLLKKRKKEITMKNNSFLLLLYQKISARINSIFQDKLAKISYEPSWAEGPPAWAESELDSSRA